MTLPLSTVAPVPPAPPQPEPPSSVKFPLGWLLSNASPAVQYRAIVDVARLTGPGAPLVAALPLAHRPALELALLQGTDGTWHGAMLAVPGLRAAHFEGVGTINAVRRFLEYGWDRESPPLYHARRLLFRLLAEDEDPQFLFELAPKKPDELLVRRGRQLLREAAAATLAQAGYESDPRVRGAARRILDRVSDYLASPLSAKPWVRVGNKQVLAPEAAPPSVYALWMLAWMPQFRSEHHARMERLYTWLSQPLPRQESMQLVGEHIVPQPHLVLGDQLPHRNAADADVPAAIAWLELVARLGFLRRHEGWSKLFERFLDDRDRDGVWHPHKGMATPKSADPFVWPLFPLEPTGKGGDDRWVDVTFRLGLIARLSGRPIEIV